MLDITDLIPERGGDPKKVKESQRKRFASEEVVDEVISLYTQARSSALSFFFFLIFLFLCLEGWE